MASTISPNMNLIVPTVGSEPGPNYALDINSSLTLIDQHDHSPGRGVQITPAGININSNLSFNDNALLNLNYESFIAQASVPTTVLQAISVAPVSSINELFYTDSNGNSTQITKNGSVNAIASSIPGESYVAGTFIWTQAQSSLPTTPANFDIGSITIRPNVAMTTNGVVLGPPSGISSQYGINLPLLPVGTPAFLTIDTSGNISSSPSTVAGITGANIAAATITGSNIAAGTITGSNIASQTITASNIANATITSTQIAANTIAESNMATTIQASSTPASYVNGTGSFTTIASVSYVSTAMTSRPIFFNFNGPIEYEILSAGSVAFQLVNVTDSVTLATWTINNTSGANQFMMVPLSAFNQMFVSSVFNATKTYALQGRGPGITSNGQVLSMTVFQV
jgi:hypothetical protein